MVFQWGIRAIKLQLLANPSQKCCSDTLKVMAKLFLQLQSNFLNHRCRGKHTETRISVSAVFHLLVPVYWPASKHILSKTTNSTITASMSHSNKKCWFSVLRNVFSVCPDTWIFIVFSQKLISLHIFLRGKLQIVIPPCLCTVCGLCRCCSVCVTHRPCSAD